VHSLNLNAKSQIPQQQNKKFNLRYSPMRNQSQKPTLFPEWFPIFIKRICISYLALEHTLIRYHRRLLLLSNLCLLHSSYIRCYLSHPPIKQNTYYHHRQCKTYLSIPISICLYLFCASYFFFKLSKQRIRINTFEIGMFQ